MFSKGSVVFAALALSIQIAVATPPACVLQAVNANSQPANTPSDVKSICVNGSTVEQTLVSDCGNNYDAAMSAFSSICAGVSVTIAPWTTASSAVTQETPSALTIAGGSTIPVSTTSDVQSNSTSTSVPASVSGSGPATNSTGTTAVTATGPILTATDTVTSTQTGPNSSTATSTGAAGHVENSGLVMGAMAAAGLIMAL